MEHTSLDSDVALYRFHSGAPDYASYKKALAELVEKTNRLLMNAGLSTLSLTFTESRHQIKPLVSPQRLINAYSQALIESARHNPKIVALDADLVLDTGLIPFRDEFPDRFVECGIAEQDMVSQAGGMALEGLLPVVHSFSCFLSARPNEQIYNNATERTKIVYVGSLAGLLPGGPGHSHQAVRDIASLNGIPGLAILEPSCSREVSLVLDYCLNQAKGSSYIRLVSIPCEIPYELPDDYRLEAGKGILLREGHQVVIIGYGPVLLTQAWHAAESLSKQGVSVRLINLPWLNQVNGDWLIEALTECTYLITLDNHQISGGQGQLIAASLAARRKKMIIKHLGLTDVPLHGTNDEVLQATGLNADGIEQIILNMLAQHACQVLA